MRLTFAQLLATPDVDFDAMSPDQLDDAGVTLQEGSESIWKAAKDQNRDLSERESLEINRANHLKVIARNLALRKRMGPGGGGPSKQVKLLQRR